MVRSTVPPGASFAFDTGIRLLDEQERRTNSLDSKAAVVLGGSGVIAGFVLRGDSIIHMAPLPVSMGISVGLVASMLFALVAFATRGYQNAPRIEWVIRLMSEDDDRLKWRSLGSLEEVHWANERRLERKARLLNRAHAALLATVGGLGGYFCYLLVSTR